MVERRIGVLYDVILLSDHYSVEVRNNFESLKDEVVLQCLLRIGIPLWPWGLVEIRM